MTIDPFMIRAVVPEFDATAADYAVASAETRGRHRHVTDIAYGAEPRQRLDVFVPEGLTGPAPVHIFIHGGYWRAFKREDYHFIAETVLGAGAIAVFPEYTLMPGARMAQLVAEMRQAALWVGAHIGEHGGDPARITASGHSAGAHLASYLASLAPHEHGFPAVPIRALLLVSGLYDLRLIATSFLQAELSLTPEEVGEWSPCDATPAPGTHVTVAVGMDETEPFHVQAQDYAFAAEKRGATVERFTVSGHNHMSIVRDLGRPETRMGRMLVEVIGRG